MKAVKAPCDCQLDSFDSFEPLTLFNKVFSLLHEFVPPLSYFFLSFMFSRMP